MKEIIDEIRIVLADELGIGDRLLRMLETDPLLGGVPELDSVAVLRVVLALEDRFGFTFGSDELTHTLFESLASMAAFVAQKLGIEAGVHKRSNTPRSRPS